MSASDMDRRITIQQPVVSKDGYGEPIITNWTPVATVWAQVIPVSGREYFDAAAARAEKLTRFRIWWRSGITETMRVVYDDRNYDIRSVVELGRREGLEIAAEATE